jgi:aldose 1-epimerase
MNKIAHTRENNSEYIVIQTENKASRAVICPAEGGRLKELVLNGQLVITEPKITTYASNYASAILFPFANRIKEGKYFFRNKEFSLECNEVGRNNAIHGLIYDKKFHFSGEEVSEDEVSASFMYHEKNPPEGFPFRYRIELTYSLSKHDLRLEVNITNKDEEAFPFTLGWHPYFYTSNKETANLAFESKFKVITYEDMITAGFQNGILQHNMQLDQVQLDDCFALLERKVNLITPETSVEIKGEYVSKFLQLYTPENENLIAIEPMTGIPNSFKNKKVLKVLQPKEVFRTTWNVKFNH